MKGSACHDFFNRRHVGRWIRHSLRIAPNAVKRNGRKKVRAFLRQYISSERQNLLRLELYVRKDVEATIKFQRKLKANLEGKMVVYAYRDSIITKDER